MSLFSPTADVSVRPAVSGDEDAVARIQLSAWAATHTDVLTEDVLDKLDADRIRGQWRDAIMSPPGPGFAVLVACSGPHVVGFCAVAPAQLVSLEVLPEHRRGGHGSRLLMAGVDRLRSDGADEVVTWVLDGDTGREQFLAGAGLGPDGRTRVLATGLKDVRESRWSASL